jgi:hypothetical protein
MLGLAILFAWLLSPLGGQASLRLLSTQPLVTKANSTVFYYPIELFPTQTALPLRQSNATMLPFFAPLFVTALQTSRHNIDTPTDLFGNVRIPDINALNMRSAPDSTSAWRSIQNSSNLPYTSVFGIPIAGIPQNGNATFSLLSHYWSVNCTFEDQKIRKPWDRILPPNDTKLADLQHLSPSFDLVVDEKNSTDADIRFRYLSRTAENTTTASVISTYCSTKPTVAESQVWCQDAVCRVRAMRQVQRKPVDIWGGISPLTIFRALSKRMPGVDISATQDDQFRSELIERWMLNPMLDLENTEPGFSDISYLQKDVFTYRLQMVINTFWDATVGGIAVRMDVLDRDTYKQLEPSWSETNIDMTKHEGPHYVCNFHLAGITMAISFVLLLAANISLLLGIITRTPDVLGFVSMNARDNPHFTKYMPSYLDGKETARALRDVRVMIGDVTGDADVGHCARDHGY